MADTHGQGRHEDFRGLIGRTFGESTPWWPPPTGPGSGSPNILVVVLDDVGFSDFGCYGSDIDTPTIDSLADRGFRFTNFHTTTLCSPTRASLLTGRNHHAVGMRMLSNFDTGFPSGRGRITNRAATLAEVLRDDGFNTMAVGKWHLAPTEHTSASGPYDQWPLGRGFERYYGFLEAETDSFHPELTYDNHHVSPPAQPENGYHLTEDLVDRAIGFVRDQTSVTPEKPFFLYLAFGAAHAPHQAPPEFLEKYRGRYDRGWDAVRADRHERQIELGVLPSDTLLAPRNPGVERFSDLPADEQRFAARLQEAYAAMVDHTDHHLGRLLDYLDHLGRMDDTLVVLLSDNGASPEGGIHGSLNPAAFQNQIAEDLEANIERIDEIGGTQAHSNYPLGWAQASNTPFKLYKQFTHEGGVRCPLIVSWPARFPSSGEIRTQFHHVNDVMPTLLDLLSINAPEVYRGVPQLPLHGVSMAYALQSPTEPTRKHTQYFEMFGHRGLWHEGWKAVASHQRGTDYDRDQWELYHLDTDFSECRDLASRHPELLREMVERFWVEAGKYDVLPLDDQGFALRAKLPRPGSPRDRLTFTYYPGMAHLPVAVAPPTMNRSHAVVAHVRRTSEDDDGVLLAQGNVSCGYALYVQDNHLVYEYNYLGSHYSVRSRTTVPVEASQLSFSFEKTGDCRGVGRVFVDGIEAGTADVPHVVPHFLGWEGLDIGQDSLSSVSQSYPGSFPFTGTIDKVVVTVAPTEHDELAFERID